MPAIIARHSNKDGKFHYGGGGAASKNGGPLYGISNRGGSIIKPPGSDRGVGATPEEHHEWIESLKLSGATVSVKEIKEPD